MNKQQLVRDWSTEQLAAQHIPVNEKVFFNVK